MKVNVESDSEGEEDEEEEKVVVVEVEQRSPSPNLQDRITARQFEHMQVSHHKVVFKLELCTYKSEVVELKQLTMQHVKLAIFLRVCPMRSCRWS